MLKTKRKKYKDKKHKKGGSLKTRSTSINRSKSRTPSTPKKRSAALRIQRATRKRQSNKFNKKIELFKYLPPELQDNIGEFLKRSNKEDLTNRYNKTKFINLIKEAIGFRFYRFISIMYKIYAVINSPVDEYHIESRENYEKFKLEKEKVFLPLFNTFNKYVTENIDRENYINTEKLYLNQRLDHDTIPNHLSYYSNLEDVYGDKLEEIEKLEQLLSIFSVKELKLIFLLLQDYSLAELIYNPIFSYDDHDPNVVFWINNTFSDVNYQGVLNS